ncbi:MAG: hypothetical protein U0359_18505 [Byssovorax sp.]
MHRTAILLLGLASLAGCEIHEATAPQPATTASAENIGHTPIPPPATATAPTAAPTSAPAPSKGALAGEWTSPSCGDRKYARSFSFDDAGGFSAQDLVSPCPKGVTCVWSGIVVRKGTYAVQGSKVALTPAGAADTRGAPFPASLELGPPLAERDAAGALCPYQRADKAAH